MSIPRTLLLAAAAAGALAAPTAAGAADLTGLTSITIGGAAANGLAKQGVKTTATGTAQLVGKDRLVLPASTGTVTAKAAQVRHVGSVSLRRKVGGRNRTATLTDLRVELATKRVVTAKVSGKRMTLFTLDLRRGEYTAAAAGAVVRVSGTRASLSAAAAKAIGKRLGIKKVKAGLYGVVTVNVGARPAGAPAPGAPAPGAPAAPGTPTTPGSGTTTPGATTPSGSTPAPTVPGEPFTDPGTLARPASAVDVVGSALTWRVRDSWIRYINGESAPTVSGGATAAAPQVQPGTSTPLTYEYGFAPAGGWYDAASGKARLLFKGKVTFLFASHGIDFDVIDPEVELDGAGSRVVATFGGRRATTYAGRSVLMDLATAGLSPAVSGTTRSFASIPGTVPAAAGADVFAGFYGAGDPFGSIALSHTTAS